MNTIEKEKFLEENDWVRHGSTNWVKKEWLEEPEKLNREVHLCPHWYHPGESLDDAIAITKEELAITKTKKENALETAKMLERHILSAMRDSEWSDIRSAVRGFVKKRLLGWYFIECSHCGMKPNPFIIEEFQDNIGNIRRDG